MNMAPHTILINTQGQNFNIQTIYRGPLDGLITYFDVTLSFAVTEVSAVYDFEYCISDNIFVTTFDREEIINYSFEQSLAKAAEVIASIERNYYTISF